MATNRVQPGQTLTWTNGTGGDVVSGQVVVIGNRIGVALGDIADGEDGDVAVEEVFSLPKAAEALSQGAALYWDADGDPVGGTAGTGAVTATSTDNTPAGYAAYAAASADATVDTKLNG